MPPNTRRQLARWLGLGAGLVLAACQSAATPAVPVTRVETAATATLAATTTSVATSLPSATRPPATDTATVQPTAAAATATTTEPPSPTFAPTVSLAPATATATAQPTRTAAPAASATMAPPSLYSTTGGPAGFSSRIQCKRAGAPCAPVMPPGDLGFQLTLASDAGVPWTHFVSYGLSVEKDGANAADMFMFVDAGWLQPGAVVGFGASRDFAHAGVYVIRSAGCLTTDTASSSCSWTTIAGDVLTFVIQP